MIGDRFVRERRSCPTSVFVGVGATGGAGALIVGAAGLQFVSSAWVTSLPLIGDMASWRLTLLFLGAPGPLITLLFALLVREPRRVDHGVGLQAPVGGVFPPIGRHGLDYLGLSGLPPITPPPNPDPP